MLPEWPRLLLLAVGAVTLLLGLILWSLDLDKRANRAFAGLLALKGGILVLSQVPFMEPDATRFVFAAMPYLIIPLVPLALYFASVFPRRRGLLGRPGGGWWTLAAIVLLWSAYLRDHTWFWTIEQSAPDHHALVAVPGLASYAAFGPMSLLLWLSFPVFGALAVLFVLDYANSREGPQRMSHFLVGTGFLVNAAFDGTRQLSALRTILADPQGYPFAPWGWAAAFLPSLSLVAALAALAIMVVHRFEHSRQERILERRAYVLAAAACLLGLLPLVLPGGALFDNPVIIVALATFRLMLPLAVTYGLLRYSLFDIDVRVRRGLGYVLLIGLFGSVYLLASETVEGMASDRYGDISGLAVAALMALFAIPLSRFTQRVARTVLPSTLNDHVLHDAERLYAAQFEMLNEDGHLTNKERRCLDELRQRLGLGQDVAQRIESMWASATAGGAQTSPAGGGSAG